MATKTAFVQCISRNGLIWQRSPKAARVLPIRFGSFQKVRVRKRRTPPHVDRMIHMEFDSDRKNTSETPQSSSEAVDTKGNLNSLTTARFGLGAVYVSFVIYAFFLAPGSWSEPGEIGKILSGNLDDTNDLFFTIFNLAGVAGANLAALLNAGAPRQKLLPTNLFSLAGVFLGFPAIGPFLVGRNYAPNVYAEEVQERGVISRILESRIFSIGSLLFALWLYAFALRLFSPGTMEFHDVVLYASALDLSRLLSNDRGVCVTSLDLLVLSSVIWGPLTEDMARRGWFKQSRKLESVLTALSFMLVPVLGPAVYLVLRPRLPSQNLKQSP